MKNEIVNTFVDIVDVEELIDCVEEGLHGGIHMYKEEPNGGIFDEDFLTKLIYIQQGDNDIDYELGHRGYDYLTSIEGLVKLSKRYLKDLENYNNSDIEEEVLINCKTSLSNIINKW